MKISIITSTYNHEKFLGTWISGITQQTYENYEVILVNDASTDNTLNILSKIKDKRFKIFHNKKNKGVIKNISFALKKANGELIFPMATDDFLKNNIFFEQGVLALRNNPDLSGFFGKTELRTVNLKNKCWEMGHADILGRIKNHEAIELFFSNRLFVPGSSALWKRKKFDEAGGFDYRLGAQCDYFINHILPMLSGVYFWKETITVMRKSDQSLSAKVNNNNFFLNHARFEKKAKTLLGNLRPSTQQWHNWRKSVINARLQFELNGTLFKRLDEAFNCIHEWEKDALAPYLGDIRAILESEAKPFNHWLQHEGQKAHRIFDKIAGRIQNPPRKPCDTGSKPSCNKLKGLLKTTAALLKLNR